MNLKADIDNLNIAPTEPEETKPPLVEAAREQSSQASSAASRDEERAARNRRNAQHSTGPRTQAGKDRSRWNSIRHGLLARTLIGSLDPEDEAVKSFQQWFAELHAHVQPAGPIEQLLVERIAGAYWRMHRGAQFEAETLVKATVFWTDGVDRLNRYTAAANRELVQSLHELERVQRQRSGEQLPPPVQIDVNLNTTGEEDRPGLNLAGTGGCMDPGKSIVADAEIDEETSPPAEVRTLHVRGEPLAVSDSNYETNPDGRHEASVPEVANLPDGEPFRIGED